MHWAERELGAPSEFVGGWKSGAAAHAVQDAGAKIEKRLWKSARFWTAPVFRRFGGRNRIPGWSCFALVLTEIAAWEPPIEPVEASIAPIVPPIALIEPLIVPVVPLTTPVKGTITLVKGLIALAEASIGLVEASITPVEPSTGAVKGSIAPIKGRIGAV